MSVYLLDENLKRSEVLYPSEASATIGYNDLSSASITLRSEGTPYVKVRDFLELWAGEKFLGIYRVTSESSDYVYHSVALTAEHGIVSLQDDITDKEQVLKGSMRSILTAILGYQSRWVLGACEVPDETTFTLECDRADLLSSLFEAVRMTDGYMLTYDQTASPWTVSLVKAQDTPSCECRLMHNAGSVTVALDVSELCTRIINDKLSGGKLDADTIGKWGVVQKAISFDDEEDQTGLETYCRAYLEGHKNPAVSVSVDAYDLSEATGEPFDALVIGKTCRVCLPEYNVVQNQRIVSMSYGDFVGEPEHVTLALSTVVQDAGKLVSTLRNETVHMRTKVQQINHLGADIRIGQDWRRKAEIIINELLANIDLSTAYEDVVDNVKVKKEAGLSIDGIDGRLKLYAQETGNTLDEFRVSLDGISNEIWTVDEQGNKVSRLASLTASNERFESILYPDGTGAESAIQQLRNSIDLRVTKDGVVNAINLSGEGVRIDGSKIQINGDTTIDGKVIAASLDGNSLSGVDINAGKIETETMHVIEALDAGYINTNHIYTDDGEFATQAWVGEQGYMTKLPDVLRGASLTVTGDISGRLITGTGLTVSGNISTGGSIATWKSQEVVVGLTYSAPTATTPPFYNSSGIQVNTGLNYVKSVSISKETVILNYLGK